MGPYQRTPKEVARAMRYSGLGVRSVGPVGDFLERNKFQKPRCFMPKSSECNWFSGSSTDFGLADGELVGPKT